MSLGEEYHGEGQMLQLPHVEQAHAAVGGRSPAAMAR